MDHNLITVSAQSYLGGVRMSVRWCACDGNYNWFSVSHADVLAWPFADKDLRSVLLFISEWLYNELDTTEGDLRGKAALAVRGHLDATDNPAAGLA